MNNEILFNIALTLTLLFVFSFSFGLAAKAVTGKIPNWVKLVNASSLLLLIPCWFIFIIADIWS